jgi:(1->4)-alpha-D-glucan 1-alpha-D-glucosylmutase
LSVQAFHQACVGRARSFPHALLATATHDHKRGEDLRMRIAVLSQMPQQWAETVRGWMALNAPLRSAVPSETGAAPDIAPHPADELMLYQMLVGAWPIGLRADDANGLHEFAERIERWQTKALREAKQVSDWVLPNVEYEEACKRFLHGALELTEDNRFLPQLAAWVEKLTPIGVANSLAQTVLRLTVPGVPDLYQGTEFWDFSLVDPDNRRPVDFALRKQLLDDRFPVDELLENLSDGRAKLHVIRKGLEVRKAHPGLFYGGQYSPLYADAGREQNVLAFALRSGGRTLIAVAPRLFARLMQPNDIAPVGSRLWGESRLPLPRMEFEDVLTGRRHRGGATRMADLLAEFPVALLLG